MDQDVNSVNTSVAPDPPTAPSTQDRLTFLNAKLKSTVKRKLTRKGNQSSPDESEHSDIFDDAAFNPQQIFEASPIEHGSLKDKLHRSVHGIAATVKNPKRSLRSKYARVIAGNVGGRPEAYDAKYDEELVDAHDALQRANRRAQSVYTDDSSFHSDESLGDEKALADDDGKETVTVQHDVKAASARVRRVEAQRESLEDAWILGRHVKRVRVVKPMLKPPEKSEFMSKKTDSQDQEMHWIKRLLLKTLWHTRGFTSHHVDDFDEPPFDMKELQLTIERFTIVSAPWQNFLVQVREVYLWKNPSRTLRFMILYWILWYFQHIATALFAWVIFATVKNRSNPTQIETIRKRIERAKSDQAKAQAWGELIQRHGKHDWVEPFLDETGPLIQLELGDMSNLLEIMQNFYRWERPRKTMSTLLFFIVCLLISTLTDMKFCVRLVWMGAGCFFFFTLPLSARYPKYRRLFNPIYWVFWDIPNRAELAIMHLQQKAVLRDAARLEAKKKKEPSDEKLSWSSSSGNESQLPTRAAHEHHNDIDLLQAARDDDRITFHAVNSVTHLHGRLKFLRDGFWYRDKKLQSFYQYSRLYEIRKIEISKANDSDASRTAKIASRIEQSLSLQVLPSGIEFVFDSPACDIVSSAASRDESEMILGDEERLSLTVSESDRDKIFSLVISWSKLKWQPQFSLNKKDRLSADADNPARRGRGNERLDRTIKGFVIE